MINLIAYKTNIGLFLKPESYFSTALNNCLINGRYPEKVSNEWYKINETSITDFKRKQVASTKQTGWKLKSPKVPGISGVPETLAMQDLRECWDKDSETKEFTGDYSGIAGLYEPVYEIQEESFVDEEFSLNITKEFHVENYSSPVSMKISQSGEGYSKPQEVDLTKITCWEEIERLLTPEFLLHERPCKLTSTAMYRIVRQHVRQNINPLVCKITSDYDFCFTVKKTIEVKPYTARKEKFRANFKSFNPPRFETNTVQSKEVEVFKMSHNTAESGSRPYKGYDAIPELQADNLQQLAEKLKVYLEELMQELNTPVYECKHCNGTGHIITEIELKG